jgi:flagellar assembly factor FliW
MSGGLNNPNNGGDSRMAVTLQSSRFGELQIPAEAVLDFPNGLIGLGGRRFALLARSEESAFVWLHSMDDPELAVPVTSPWRFFEDYALELSDDEAERIGVNGPEDAMVYVTVRSAAALEDFCANLRAPILVVGSTGHQVINQAPDAPVRAPLFAGLHEEPSTKAA